MPNTKDILDRLRAAGSTTPAIRAIARDLRRHPELAPALWSTNVLEARILATMIADPLAILEAEVERWVSEFDCWSVCDAACICLLWRTPFAWRKVREWARRKPEFERRAAFALLAGLAIHDKTAPDKQFRAAFRLITKAATDDRHYVKKSVNWALRQIGKRNAGLREAAMDVAQQLIATDSRSARWIGRDALRELSART